jgi:hypothetical protein
LGAYCYHRNHQAAESIGIATTAVLSNVNGGNTSVGGTATVSKLRCGHLEPQRVERDRRDAQPEGLLKIGTGAVVSVDGGTQCRCHQRNRRFGGNQAFQLSP